MQCSGDGGSTIRVRFLGVSFLGVFDVLQAVLGCQFLLIYYQLLHGSVVDPQWHFSYLPAMGIDLVIRLLLDGRDLPAQVQRLRVR